MATKKNQTSFKPGKSANPSGRPPGTTPRARFRKMVDADMPGIVQTLIQAANGGDIQAIRVILDRTIAPLKATAADLSLRTTGTLTERGEHVIRAMLIGQISPDTAKVAIDVLGAQANLLEHSDIVLRLEQLEALQRPSSKS
jgi:hypothetical protein